MFYFALITSVLSFLIANFFVRLAARKNDSTYLLCISFTIALSCGLFIFSTMTFCNSISFLIAAYFLHWTKRTKYYFSLSLLLLFLITSLFSIEAYFQILNVQKRYPMESISERLPLLEESPTNPPIQTRLVNQIEENLENQYRGTTGQELFLKRLHENMTQQFIAQPGFGAGRMNDAIFYPLKERNRKSKEGIPNKERNFSSEVESVPHADAVHNSKLHEMHIAAVLDFLNAMNWGYVKDRDHVAGFQSHGFGNPQLIVDNYRVETIDLIGLVIHKDPKAYVSNQFPDMENLRKAPTRSLFPFEEQALKELRTGKDTIVLERKNGGIAMLGAIRVTTQCQKCHGGNRGDLLGAFSYELIKR